MKQIKPVVTRKNEFEKRHVTKLIILPGKVWTTKFLMQGTESAVFYGNDLAHVKSYRLGTGKIESGKYSWRNQRFQNRGF